MQHHGVAIITLVLLMKVLRYRVVVRLGCGRMASGCWADVRVQWSDHRIFVPDAGGGDVVC